MVPSNTTGWLINCDYFVEVIHWSAFIRNFHKPPGTRHEVSKGSNTVRDSNDCLPPHGGTLKLRNSVLDPNLNLLFGNRMIVDICTPIYLNIFFLQKNPKTQIINTFPQMHWQICYLLKICSLSPIFLITLEVLYKEDIWHVLNFSLFHLPFSYIENLER